MEACNNPESAVPVEARHHKQEPQMTQAVGGSSSDDPNPSTVLTYLTFLEHKIGHLRGIVCSAPRQVVSAELSCIAVQLVSISNSLAAEEGASMSPLMTPPPHPHPHELLGDDSEPSDHDPHDAEDDDDERPPPPPLPGSSYEVIELDREEILAPHVHSCKVCGKGFKRDANLRMHMRGHGEEYKTAAALAKPLPPPSSSSSSPSHAPRCFFYSCPFVGCKRNREHRSFQPLKTAVCVKNHYRRSHCDKSYTCRRCNVKRFSVLADLRTHEKHCGRDRWVCSCGTSFSRKDKLFCHVAAFDGHAPALPPEEGNDAADRSAPPNAHGTDQQLMVGTEAAGRMDNMEECFSDATMFNGFALTGEQCLDDARGSLSPMGLDSCDFDGFDLFGASGIDF